MGCAFFHFYVFYIVRWISLLIWILYFYLYFAFSWYEGRISLKTPDSRIHFWIGLGTWEFEPFSFRVNKVLKGMQLWKIVLICYCFYEYFSNYIPGLTFAFFPPFLFPFVGCSFTSTRLLEEGCPPTQMSTQKFIAWSCGPQMRFGQSPSSGEIWLDLIFFSFVSIGYFGGICYLYVFILTGTSSGSWRRSRKAMVKF